MRDFFINMKKSPLVIFVTAVLTAAACYGVQFNPFTKEFGSLERLFKTDYAQLLTDIAAWLQSRATDPALLATTIAIAALSLIALSIVCGLLFSGLSYVFYVNTYNGIHHISKKRKTAALFRDGVNKRFWSMSGYTFLSLTALALIVFLLAYLNMPMAISINKVIAGDTNQIIPMLLLIAVMIAVMFFTTVFYSMYVSYMMPSIVAFKKGAVKVGFKVVNSYCWYLVPRTLLFLFYNVVIEIGLLAINYGLGDKTMSLIVFGVNFLLRTVGILFYAHYVFKTYIEMKEDMFDEA